MIRIEVFAEKDKFLFDYEGSSPLTLGRLPSCDVPIPVGDVSREHCRIVPDGEGGFRVFDLGSKNGVVINGKKIVEDEALREGDEVRLCPDARFLFGERRPDAAPAPAKAPAAKPEAGKAPEGAKAPAPAAASAGAAPDSGAAPAVAGDSGAGPAVEETPAERARRVAMERARERKRATRMVLLAIVVLLGVVGYGGWVYVRPLLEKPAAGGDVAAALGDAAGPSVADAAAASARPGTDAEAEREWGRLDALELDPELLAGALDAYARRYPASPHARDAQKRASSLRKVAAGGSVPASELRGGTATARSEPRSSSGAAGGAGPSGAVSSLTGKAAALEAEIDAQLKEGALLEARFLASTAGRLFQLSRLIQDKLERKVEMVAYEQFGKERDAARELLKSGRPLDAYARLAAGSAAWARFSFAKEAQGEVDGAKDSVSRAIEAAGLAGAPTGGAGDRVALEKLVPEAKRATLACDFDTALDRWRQVLELPLTDQERLDFQWRVFDLRRSKELFRDLLLRISATAAGGKNAPEPLKVTITQAIKGTVIDGDAAGVKISLEIPGESTKNQQIYERKWRDLAPFQVLEIFRGLDLDGDGLLALAAYCFEAEYEIDAHQALCECWDKFPTWRPEAASLLRRRTGITAGPGDLCVFEGRLITKAEQKRITDERIAAKAEAERIKAELAAARKDASGKAFLQRALALIEAGSYVEGRSALQVIAAKWKDLEAGKEAKLRWEDPVLRRRPQRVNGRDDNRVSIYCMAEGYPVESNQDQRAFDGAADRLKSILEKCDLWKEYDGYFNYYALNLWSKDRGVDRDPGGVEKDTPLGGKVTGGTFTIANGLVRQILMRWPGPSVGVAIGNDNASVATGGGGACAIAKGMVEVAGHEIGHAFGDLGDEYDIEPGTGKPNGPNGRSKTPLPSTVLGPNLIGGNQKDEMRKLAPWAHWIALGADNWTLKPVDLYEGGNRTPFDVWRPQRDCRMRTSSSPYCAVCMEQMILHLYNVVRPIDEVEPKAATAEITEKESIIFKATCLRPKSRPLDVVWEISDASESEAPDGSTTVREAKKKRLENVSEVDLPDGRRLVGAKVTATPGIYDVTVTVSDPTPWVQLKERPESLKERHAWRLKVKGRG